MRTVLGLLAMLVMNGAAATKATPDQRLYVSALLGEPEAQEAISRKLLDPRFRLYPDRGPSQSKGATFLYLAAVKGNVKAQERMAVAVRAGKYGLVKSTAAGICWADAAKGATPSIECIRQTRFKRKESEPYCAQLTARGPDKPARAADAPAIANQCIAAGMLSILVPGGPPSKATEIVIAEFARHDIDYVVTGDVFETDFEAFRESFNAIMAKEITSRLGADIFKRIQTAPNAKIARQLPDRP